MLLFRPKSDRTRLQRVESAAPEPVYGVWIDISRNLELGLNPAASAGPRQSPTHGHLALEEEVRIG